MKVVHVLKRIEMIDNDIKELKKLEKSIQRNKSFSTPIYMSIEKQINILLGERIKLFELKIDNPPAYLVEEIEGKPEDRPQPVKKPEVPAHREKKKRSGAALKKAKPEQKTGDDDDDLPIMMLTQDQIDAKFGSMQAAAEKKKPERAEKKENDDNVKLLDIALEKGSMKKDEGERKVRFFRENFPGENG